MCFTSTPFFVYRVILVVMIMVAVHEEGYKRGWADGYLAGLEKF